MNVIVSNERKNELSNLSIDIIKSVDGIYSVEELVGMFTNFFFNKMILDITAIKDYGSYSNLKKLFEVVDANKVILVLKDDSTCSSKEFISDLVTLGLYNFTNNVNEVMELFNKPKTFNDVSSLQIRKGTYEINEQIDKESGRINDEKKEFQEATRPEDFNRGNKKIIGVVNLTEHSGATTLVIQMVKQLSKHYNAMAVEMNKQDFIFYNLPDLKLYSSTSKEDLMKKISEDSDLEVVVVDLNNMDNKDFCTDVLYLIEPGNIKMMKLIRKNGKIFEELTGEKIVLNRSNLTDQEITEFEVESNIKVFSMVSNFRDNLDSVVSVDRLLNKLGFRECGKMLKDDNVKKSGFFGKKRFFS